MRHANGDFLRFIPDDYEMSLSSVKIHPRNGVIPNTHEEEYNRDLQFQSSFPSILKSGSRDAIALSSQCGILYSKLYKFCNHREEVHCSVSQALVLRIEQELEWYYSQMAELESELSPVANNGEGGRGGGMTLRTLVVRLSPLRDNLRSLCLLVEGIRNLRGGKLLSSILSHGKDGNIQHSKLVSSIAAQISIPWYSMLNAWLTRGTLEDVHAEFFIMELTRHESLSSGYFSWHTRFVLVPGQIPREIMTEELAKMVLAVGKGINFVRYCLMDRDWEVDADITNNTAEERIGITTENRNEEKTTQEYEFVTLSDLNDYQDESCCISTLYQAVTRSSTKVHQHILNSLLQQHQLLTHLHALKRFLFLGQGDFVSSLVESLHREFRGRTTLAGIYSHTLSSVLEGALRTSNARYLSDCVLDRLNIKLMVDESDAERYWMGPPPKEVEGELIPWEDKEESIQDPWDHICLEYVIDSPLDAIVHTAAMESYYRVFLFLFRLKRVEWMLNDSWRQSTALNHAILIETKAGGADAPHISAAAEQSSFLLRRISSTRQTMLHFVSNLQSYLMFEVLEGGWDGLVQSVNNSKSLDGVISAHDSYLNEILVKTLLNNVDAGGNSDDNGKGKSLEDLLRRLLSIALKFGKFQDFIFGNALAALNKAAMTRRLVAETSQSGTWGRKTVDEEEGQVFVYLADASLFQFVEKTAREFDKVLGALLKMLKKEVFDDGGEDKDDSQPSLNHDALRFLLFRLDYSGYYHRQAKARSKKGSSTSASRESG
jgi:gamma-tubulin complex component 3